MMDRSVCAENLHNDKQKADIHYIAVNNIEKLLMSRMVNIRYCFAKVQAFKMYRKIPFQPKVAMIFQK